MGKFPDWSNCQVFDQSPNQQIVNQFQNMAVCSVIRVGLSIARVAESGQKKMRIQTTGTARRQ